MRSDGKWFFPVAVVLLALMMLLARAALADPKCPEVLSPFQVVLLPPLEDETPGAGFNTLYPGKMTPALSAALDEVAAETLCFLAQGVLVRIEVEAAVDDMPAKPSFDGLELTQWYSQLLANQWASQARGQVIASALRKAIEARLLTDERAYGGIPPDSRRELARSLVVLRVPPSAPFPKATTTLRSIPTPEAKGRIFALTISALGLFPPGPPEAEGDPAEGATPAPSQKTATSSDTTITYNISGDAYLYAPGGVDPRGEGQGSGTSPQPATLPAVASTLPTESSTALQGVTTPLKTGKGDEGDEGDHGGDTSFQIAATSGGRVALGENFVSAAIDLGRDLPLHQKPFGLDLGLHLGGGVEADFSDRKFALTERLSLPALFLGELEGAVYVERPSHRLRVAVQGAMGAILPTNGLELELEPQLLYTLTTHLKVRLSAGGALLFTSQGIQPPSYAGALGLVFTL